MSLCSARVTQFLSSKCPRCVSSCLSCMRFLRWWHRRAGPDWAFCSLGRADILMTLMWDRQSSHPVKTLLQYHGMSLEALPGVAYPGFRDNRSTLNTKTGYKKNGPGRIGLKFYWAGPAIFGPCRALLHPNCPTTRGPDHNRPTTRGPDHNLQVPLISSCT